MVFLLRILFVIYVLRCSLSCCPVFFEQPYDHLLEKAELLVFLQMMFSCDFNFPIWLLGSGEVPDLSIIPDLCFFFTLYRSTH